MLNIKLSDLTLAGWLLVIMTGGIMVVLSYFTVSLLYDSLPWLLDLDYLLAVIPFIPGFTFFVVIAAVLKALGLPVVKHPADSAWPPS